MNYDASDTKAIRKAARVARAAEAGRRVVVYNLMSSPGGRAWMHARLVRCHVFSSSFSSDPLAMAFSEGERNVGLQDLTDIMSFAPDQYIQMMREANDKDQADDRRSDDGPSGNPADLGRNDDGPRVESEYDPRDENDDRDEH